MKRKGARDIPDLAAARRNTPSLPETERKSKHASQTAARNVKPPATSAKSGRRGQ
jgi:hypothetical protein